MHPLHLQNITGWRANSALVLLAVREGDTGGGGRGLYLLSIQHQIMLVTVQNAAVNSKSITRVLK